VKAVAPSAPLAPALKRSLDQTIAGELETAVIDEDDIVRVDTSLVNLNVSVFNNQLKSFVGTLEKNDSRSSKMDARNQSPILRPPTCL